MPSNDSIELHLSFFRGKSKFRSKMFQERVSELIDRCQKVIADSNSALDTSSYRKQYSSSHLEVSDHLKKISSISDLHVLHNILFSQLHSYLFDSEKYQGHLDAYGYLIVEIEDIIKTEGSNV